MTEPILNNFLAVIKVVGVGGAGGNAINQMIEKRLRGIEFIAINTDGQDLLKSEAHVKLEIGSNSTRSLGAGADPEVGRRAAEEHIDEIAEVLRGADMVFVAAGEGGGTGTGAAPIVARAAKQAGALTVGVVTRPFEFEGRRRAENAQAGIDALRQEVDTLIVVPNQKLIDLNDTELSLKDSFSMADDILRAGVQGISDLITEPGLINLDFADVKSVMQGAGTALMGIGTAKGEDRAVRAAEEAINHPLLENSIDNARGVLIHFLAGTNMKLVEVNEAARLIQEVVHPSANIIWGTAIDDTLGDEIRITVIGAGFDEVTPRPVSRPAYGMATPAAVAPVAAASAPAVEEEVAVETTPLSRWFDANSGPVEIVPEPVVTSFEPEELEPVTQIEPTRKETAGFFGRRRESKNFDDGFDLPDFLK
ncbi:MAG: cell division protein FtsZ [Micrococcales bacterium]|nr:cell division protein FtsZ [Micrococcales bacterium]NBR54405.1 cell division protein FtsZ [Micrococcales bacterium]NBR60344.1 cell division protein FtsZ [Actinomycetota bacterium]NBT46241.1 cell division protein FtsZ [Actinomycetota bacterium]NBY43513.1 cell division protein FtsZ [Micrococcales bacterium]